MGISQRMHGNPRRYSRAVVLLAAVVLLMLAADCGGAIWRVVVSGG